MTDPPPQLYAKNLLPLGYGYPLWTPEPSHELLLRRRDGLRIGDVGVLDLENGSFDVFFNLCLPRDHPLHRATGVPDNFVPIALDEWDIASFPHAEYPGRVISTSSVTSSTVAPTGAAVSRPFTYDFSLSSSEGALLILPEGAESYKLRKRQLFKEAAMQNAVNWYEFAEQRLGRIITHDSLYLITGLYKTNSWSVAAFHRATGIMETSAQFKASQVGGASNLSYTWDTMRALDWRVGPQIDVGMPNQTVFISGFKIAIREGVLGKRRVEVEVDAPPARSKSLRFSNGGTGRSSSQGVGNMWKRLVSRGGTRVSEKFTKQTAESRLASSLKSANEGATPQVAINHVPQLQSIHPSDLVNRYLLRKEPSASVAITHDSEWSILVEKGILESEDFGDDNRLERIISENYHVVSQEAVATLQTISNSSVRSMYIDDAARVALEGDLLEDAEELLSRRLIRQMESDHFTLANRALVRTRLRHWDAALRDAEMSICIQPSVAAHVAKGLALFGKGQYETAIEAFNVALRQCDLHDRDLVLLVKSIALFDIGYHAESMAGVADVLERCPAEVKAAYSSVQAEMHIRLATFATQNKAYDRAFQLLARAKSLGPFHASPDLDIISLMCGWKFDNLLFTICRKWCECLYVVGRTREAVEELRVMTHDLEEAVISRQDNASWVTSFTQECRQSLEGPRNNEKTSKNYTETISQHSIPLNADTITPEERSQAPTAAHATRNGLDSMDEEPDWIRNPPRRAAKNEPFQGMSRPGERERPFVLLPTRTLSDKQLEQGPTSNPQALANFPPSHNPDPDDGPVIYASAPASQVCYLDAESVSGTSQIEGRSARLPNITLLIPHITALREKLGSDITRAEHDPVLHNQLIDALNSFLHFLRHQAHHSLIPEDSWSVDALPPNKDEERRNRPRKDDSDAAFRHAYTPSLESRTNLDNLISTWKRRRESGQDIYPSVSQIQISSSPMATTDVLQAGQHQRSTLGDHSADFSVESWCGGAIHTDTQQIDVSAELPRFAPSVPMLPRSAIPDPIPAHPHVPLHDVLLEILREERLAHRASINQQRELTRQIQNFNEWLMKELQDRLTELWSVTARAVPYPQRPMEPGHSRTQTHLGASIAPSVAPTAGTPWTAPWYPPPSASFSTTPYNAPPFGGTSFNPAPYGPMPFAGPVIPSSAQNTPFIPPDPALPAFRFEAPAIPQVGPPKDESGHFPLPPRKISPTGAAFPPPVSMSAHTGPVSSHSQGTNMTSTSAPKSLLLISECGSPTVVGTVGQSPTSAAGKSPLSALSTRMEVPVYESPKKATPNEIDEDNTAKSVEKRRPGVTFGDITYI